MTRVINDAEIVRQHEHHWHRQGWTGEQIAATRAARERRLAELSPDDDLEVTR